MPRRTARVSCCTILAVVAACAWAACTASHASGSASPPKVPIEKLAAIVPGEPLGPWNQAAEHPLAVVIWPDGRPAPADALAFVEAIASTFAKVGKGALVLAVNAPSGRVPTATISREAVLDLAALAGRAARKEIRRQREIPVALIRGVDGTMRSLGPLDLGHEAYNLTRGLKDELGVRFADLSPLRKTVITNLEGELVNLERYLDALPTRFALLDIWGTWCPPCQRSLPHLKALSEKYRGRVGFVGITCEAADDLNERLASLTRFQESRGAIPYPLLLGDLWGMRLKVTEFLGFPTMLLLERGPAGWSIVWQHVGFEPGDEAGIEAAVSKAVGRS